MQAKVNNNHANILETLFQEFEGHSIYGLELILDELYDKSRHESAKKDADPVDWFGLSDLSI
jgi:hypothetical protein